MPKVNGSIRPHAWKTPCELDSWMSNRRPEQAICTMLVLVAIATLWFLFTASKLTPSHVIGTVALAALLIVSTQRFRLG